MQADEALVSYIASTYYEMSPILGSIKRLPGYDDRNFSLTNSTDHKTYVLKLVNRDESTRELTDIIDEILSGAYEHCHAESQGGGHFVVPKLIKTSGDKVSTYTTVKYRTNNDDDDDHEEVKCNIRMCEFFDGMTMLEYIQSKPRPLATPRELEHLYFRLGKMCNQLFVYLRTQVHLVDQLEAVRARASSPWVLSTCEKFIRANLDHLFPLADGLVHPRRQLVERTLDEYLTETKPKLDSLPRLIVHSDLSNGNILVNRQSAGQLCVIDFQDVQVGQQVTELSVMMLYNILDRQQMPLEQTLARVPRWIYLGYQSSTSWPLNPSELSLAPSLMKLRLCQSLLNGLMAIERDPDNLYVMQTNQRGWQLLELMSNASKPDELASLWLAPTGADSFEPVGAK